MIHNRFYFNPASGFRPCRRTLLGGGGGSHPLELVQVHLLQVDVDVVLLQVDVDVVLAARAGCGAAAWP